MMGMVTVVPFHPYRTLIQLKKLLRPWEVASRKWTNGGSIVVVMIVAAAVAAVAAVATAMAAAAVAVVAAADDPVRFGARAWQLSPSATKKARAPYCRMTRRIRPSPPCLGHRRATAATPWLTPLSTPIEHGHGPLQSAWLLHRRDPRRRPRWPLAQLGSPPLSHVYVRHVTGAAWRAGSVRSRSAGAAGLSVRHTTGCRVLRALPTVADCCRVSLCVQRWSQVGGLAARASRRVRWTHEHRTELADSEMHVGAERCGLRCSL